MTNTKNLYERIAEQEGCDIKRSYANSNEVCFFGRESSDGVLRVVFMTEKDFCFRLIEKYKLSIENENYEWCVMKHDIHCDPINIWHKNLENAVMLAALSISEGE